MAENPASELIRVAERLRGGRRVVALTGAGVSAESKIPTFRDAMSGLWASFDPQRLATPEAFEADPATVSKWYDFRREKCAQALPNPGHLALARLEGLLETRGGRLDILTQNVDGLHQRAGSKRITELHGSIMRWRCTRTNARADDLPMPLPSYPMPSPSGGWYRPDVVWFGEMLPEAALAAAWEALEGCEVFLSIGTSAVVYPAAGFADEARSRGALIVEVNPEQTPLTSRADVVLRGLSGVVLPQLVDAIMDARMA
ncbi:MAG: NAD-dependent deacylase [Phycisphaeraceae bacterium]|nr:NAD-dependent deacylase [Phycisphaeraceae bacterium]MCW5754349.1 NAD-dependent deacylase [Phycisphaeraceae bacterium]